MIWSLGNKIGPTQSYSTLVIIVGEVYKKSLFEYRIGEDIQEKIPIFQTLFRPRIRKHAPIANSLSRVSLSLRASPARFREISLLKG